MSVSDYAFLGVCVVILCVILVTSKVMRAVLWETLRYPFRSSRIDVEQGQIVVSRSQSQPAKDGQPTSHAGAK